jgi:hypothetical protein
MVPTLVSSPFFKYWGEQESGTGYLGSLLVQCVECVCGGAFWVRVCICRVLTPPASAEQLHFTSLLKDPVGG